MGKKKLKKIPSASLKQIPPIFESIPKESFYNKHPKFSFTYITDSSQYCLKKCQNKEKSAIIDKLHSLSKTTWGNIWDSPKEGLGSEPLPNNAYKKLPNNEILTDKKFIVFRTSDKGRIIGFHENDTFYLVICDPNHTFY